jgi:hypothetical protein
MDTNTSVWSYYQPGFIHPEYVPYLKKKVKDGWGNEVEINTWKHQGCDGLVEPALVRVNKGLTFQRMFDTDPCPNGWKKAAESYCVREPLKHEPVFYTDKAFIAKRQFFDGYTANGVRGKIDSLPKASSQTDLRSVNPFTGTYVVYYPGGQFSAQPRYASPRIDDKKQYDTKWSLPSERGYAQASTTDSYLG